MGFGVHPRKGFAPAFGGAIDIGGKYGHIPFDRRIARVAQDGIDRAGKNNALATTQVRGVKGVVCANNVEVEQGFVKVGTRTAVGCEMDDGVNASTSRLKFVEIGNVHLDKFFVIGKIFNRVHICKPKAIGRAPVLAQHASDKARTTCDENVFLFGHERPFCRDGFQTRP